MLIDYIWEYLFQYLPLNAKKKKKKRKKKNYATFNNISVISLSLYHGGQIYWWRKSEYPEKPTDLPQVTDTLHRIIE